MNITHGSILAVFFTATEPEIEEGRNWYRTTNTCARKIGSAYGIDYTVVAGVIAALSPNNRWSRNLIDAEALCKTYSCGGDPNSVKVSTFNKNKEKAIRILQGENPLDVLKGLKVIAFYQCICGDPKAICIDGHAYSIWLGQRVATTKTPSISPKLYLKIAGDYSLATEQICKITGHDFLPSEVQAITWVVWRNLVKNRAAE